MQFTSQQYAELFVGFFQAFAKPGEPYASHNMEYGVLFGNDRGNVVQAVKYALDTGTDPRVISLAGVLVCKVLARSGLGVAALVCPERLLVSGLVAANIVFEDDTIVFQAWQRATQFCWELDELKLMTMELFLILDFRMAVTADEFARFCAVLGEFTLGADVADEFARLVQSYA